MTAEQLDARWIRHWADLYVRNMKNVERELLNEVGPKVAARGYFTKTELLAVGKWKANRVTGLLGDNSDEDIEDITRLALSAPLRLRHRVLCVLKGVQRPMASALLTIWNPAEHTILDINAVSTLHHYDMLTANRVADVPYADYLATCHGIVEQVGGGVTLRDLDRALWKWWDLNKE